MESRDSSKRKKEKQDEDAHYRDIKSKRLRSKSRSPERTYDKHSRRRRKRSHSKSPERSVKKEKENERLQDQEPKKDIPERKAKETDMLNTRTGGAYIPPARLRMMQAQITDKSSVAYQRLAWEALKKSIHGHINKINVGNIGIIIKELLKENIVRGRGLLCRSVIQAQAASPTFTNVYAALVAAVNSRFPNIGELLLKRLVIQFKRGFKRNDKPTCISSASFIAHLVNQRVAHEILALELLTLLVETPTDDSVEVAIAFLKECGQKLTEVSSKGVNAIFEMLRNILHEGQLDKRVQYMIEVMFQVWKDGFKDHPALIEELELVPEEEQFTHLLMLDDATDPQDILNVFKFDEKYEENEQKYKSLSKEILGSDAESGEEEGSGESGSEESEEEEGDEQKPVTIIDNTETNLVALRRTIYLTINSSLDFEECAHKLMKMQLKPGQEVELCHMFLDCCAEQRTYEKFYGLLAQRFCNINRIYIGPFEDIFKDSYSTAHRLDTNRLRNVSKFFAHLLFTDSISWEVLECVKLNEEDTTSSSRIYIKILFQELAEYMGLKKLNDRLKDQTLQGAFSGIFPRDNPKNTRFSINFFTSIGLGGLTDELREHLKQMPKNVPAPVQEINLDSESESSSGSSSSSSSSDESSSSSDGSDGENKKKKKSKKDKTKEKEPKTPEQTEADKNKNNERWGHDGFYDTYGKDARRTENQKRDKDNFVMPQDVFHRDGRNKNAQRHRDYEDRDNDDRRRRDDRNGRDSRDDSRDRNRNDRNVARQSQEENRRNYYQSTNRDEDYNRTRHDNEKSDNGGRYTDQRREDRSKRNSDREESRNRRQEYREAEEKSREDSNRDDRRLERRRNSSEEKEKSKDKPIREDSRKDQRKSDNEEERSKDKSNREDKRSNRKRDNAEEEERPREDKRKGQRYSDDVNRSREKSNREDKGRESRKYNVEENLSKSKLNKQDKEMEKRNYDEGEERSRYRSDKEEGREKKRKNYDEEGKTGNKNIQKDDSFDSKRKDKNERKANTSDLSSSKNKNKQNSSEDEDPRSNNRNKTEKHDKKKKKRINVEASSSEDSDGEDERHRKRKEKKSKHKKKGKENAPDDDGWDIKTGASIRRELGERYWEK